jgi:hypothetical protein
MRKEVVRRVHSACLHALNKTFNNFSQFPVQSLDRWYGTRGIIDTPPCSVKSKLIQQLMVLRHKPFVKAYLFPHKLFTRVQYVYRPFSITFLVDVSTSWIRLKEVLWFLNRLRYKLFRLWTTEAERKKKCKMEGLRISFLKRRRAGHSSLKARLSRFNHCAVGRMKIWWQTEEHAFRGYKMYEWGLKENINCYNVCETRRRPHKVSQNEI